VPDAVHPAGRVVVRASRDAGEHERMDLIPADINRMELFSGSYPSLAVGSKAIAQMPNHR
jgi:hypothetical protein